ncbi:carboxypeptidase-like regulatory domain-containing protein, partial [Brevundimonas sp.]
MPTSVVAQDYTSGILSGTVSDASGARVAGASVSTTSGQGTVRTTTTDANGAFRLPALAVGSYEISITSSSGST